MTESDRDRLAHRYCYAVPAPFIPANSVRYALTLHTGQLCSGSFELDSAPDPHTAPGGPVSESAAEPLLLLKMTDPPRATSGGNGWFALRAAASETVRGLLGRTAELLDVSPADIEFSFSGLNAAASVNTLYAAAVHCHCMPMY